MKSFENAQCLPILDLRTFQLSTVLDCAVSDWAESNPLQANTARSRIFRNYLRKNEFLSKTILACLSGAHMASIHEIKKCKKSRDTVPLSRILYILL